MHAQHIGTTRHARRRRQQSQRRHVAPSLLTPLFAALLMLVPALTFALPPGQAVRAATVVPDCQGSSLATAIANAAAGDTLTFATDCPAASPITLGGTQTITQDLTLDGTGHTVVIDGGGAVQLFIVNSGATFTVDALTLSHGGGTSQGGAIANNGTLTVTDSTITANAASGGVVGIGGGIYSNGALTVTGSTVSSNAAGGTVAGSGGGIVIDSGTATIANSTFSGNSASGTEVGSGGGILINSGTVAITNSTFSGNTANGDKSGSGGGILINAGTVTIANSTFSGNSASGTVAGGGGILINSGTTTTIANSTFSGNSASGTSTGAGIDAGSGTIINTIVANSTGRDVVKSGVTLTGSHNLIDDAATGTGFADGINGNIVGHPALLGTLGTYGGTNGAQTFPLLPGSFAIDAGDDPTCTAPGSGAVNALDQRGIARTQGTHCDIGAFESQGFSLMKTSGDGQSTGFSAAFAAPLVVTVVSAHGEPVDGGAVNFTAPGAGASLQPAAASATIGATTTGQARLNATANSSPGGPYTVIASVATGATPSSVAFALTNTGLAGISPASGSTTGGGSVTLSGGGFGTSVTTQVLFDGVAIPTPAVTSVSTTTLVYTAPARAAGTVTITVKVNGVTLAGSAQYLYGTVNTLPVVQPSEGTPGSPGALPASRPAASLQANPNPLPTLRP